MRFVFRRVRTLGTRAVFSSRSRAPLFVIRLVCPLATSNWTTSPVSQSILLMYLPSAVKTPPTPEASARTRRATSPAAPRDRQAPPASPAPAPQSRPGRRIRARRVRRPCAPRSSPRRPASRSTGRCGRAPATATARSLPLAAIFLYCSMAPFRSPSTTSFLIAALSCTSAWSAFWATVVGKASTTTTRTAQHDGERTLHGMCSSLEARHRR